MVAQIVRIGFCSRAKPGSKIGHVDAMRRNVGAVMNGNSLDKERILSEQQKDEFCTKQEPGTYYSKRQFFLDKEDVMYRRRPCDKHQVLVTRYLVYDVMQENLNPTYVSHPGLKRTHDLILLKYWWPEMRGSIVDYVRNCDQCQRLKGNGDKLKARVSRVNSDHLQRLENLKASLNAAYKYVNKSNKKANQNSKRLFDRRAKLRNFKFGDIVYLYSPAMKPELSRKFNKPWSGHTR